jgi:hypothetical protein
MTNREQEMEAFIEEFLKVVEDQNIAENTREGGHLARLKGWAEEVLLFGQDEEQAE